MKSNNSKTLVTLEFIRNYFFYIISKIRTSVNVILGIAFVAFSIWWIVKTNTKVFDYTNIESWWNAWGDPFIGLSTFLVAIVIWFTNLAKDWEDRLDKKITVIYNFGEVEVIKCEKAYLAHEGDIRNWGQTIGRQTIGQSIHFNFKIFELQKETEIEKEQKEFYKHYIATFYLAVLPKELENKKMIWKKDKDHPETILLESKI